MKGWPNNYAAKPILESIPVSVITYFGHGQHRLMLDNS